MRGRAQYGLKERKPMTHDEREKMITTSMAMIVVEFNNNPVPMKMWSKCAQRKHVDISQAINYLMWMVSNFKPWQGQVHRAAIFDARNIKKPCAANKIYQYEKGAWRLEQPITW